MSSYVIVLLLGLCLLHGAHSQNPRQEEAHNDALSNQVISATNIDHSEVADSMLDFALDFHRFLVTGQKPRNTQCLESPTRLSSNVVFSPFSLSNALSVLWRGSKAGTEKQLRDILKYRVPSSDKKFQSEYGKLFNLVLEKGRGVEIDYSSLLLADAGTKVYRDFFQAAHLSYMTFVRHGPFSSDPEEVRRRVNAMVEQVTRGRIQNILQEAPDPKTIWMLINAIYFNGQWENVFDEQYTQNRSFYVSSEEEEIQVPTMFTPLDVKYYSSEEYGFELAGIPYKGGQFHFYVVLPLEPFLEGLEKLELSLTGAQLQEAILKADTLQRLVFLPKLNLSEEIDLKPVLQGLGACDLFTEAADFTGIHPHRPAYLTGALHRATLEVNEVGTVATAATLTFSTRFTPEFRAQWPFLFIIMDSVNSVPIFMGRVTNPASTMKSLLVFIVFVLSSALAFPQDPDLGVEEQAQDIAQGVQAGEVPPQEEGSFVIDKEGPLPSPDNPFNVYLEENAAASGENFSEASIAKSILGFAVNFHKYLVTGDSGQQSTCGEPTVSGNPVENVVFSPLSLSNALSVLWRGSGNDTEKQLRDVLLFPEVEQRDKTFQESYGKLLNAVVAEGDNTSWRGGCWKNPKEGRILDPQGGGTPQGPPRPPQDPSWRQPSWIDVPPVGWKQLTRLVENLSRMVPISALLLLPLCWGIPQNPPKDFDQDMQKIMDELALHDTDPQPIDHNAHLSPINKSPKDLGQEIRDALALDDENPEPVDYKALLSTMYVKPKKNESHTDEISTQSGLKGTGEVKIADSIMAFGIDILKSQAAGITRNTCPSQASAKGRPDDNMVFSPLSIATALSLMWMASAETTEVQLRTALRYPLVSSDNITFHAMFRKLLDAVLKEGRGVVVDTATAILGNRGVKVQSKFFERAETYYDTQLRSVPFKDNPEITRRYINDFVKKATRGKIPELFQQTLDPQMVLMLINVVYFEGMWESQFAEGDTRNKPFFVSENEVVEVPTLFGQINVKYFRDQENDFALVGLPYKEGKFHLYIVLPNANFTRGLSDLEAKLTPEMLKKATGRAETIALSVELPKLDLDVRMNLQTLLESLGVCNFFGPEANLSRMIPDLNVFLNEAVHQAKLIVNEKGTEAAAVTFLTTTKSSTSFHANHPFIYVIMDDDNAVPIFMGRIVRPVP
ncbi:unnamed protein product [Cyprideis torosa]|uniref:Uncharacterized protein n=1 Tax=Cyprideis torosa TaxID=163714 RepID=A0A7R8W3S5_9CRUS|nr:unnamed protein product [Cyprideis torosa]CAG0883367.1 unnamed protein product [Cyprideis torosa]